MSHYIKWLERTFAERKVETTEKFAKPPYGKAKVKKGKKDKPTDIRPDQYKCNLTRLKRAISAQKVVDRSML